MQAIVDCNSFYCSCERLFQPQLAHRPVIVLSNNDGCIVSRTDEAKQLGLPEGTGMFLELYNDMMNEIKKDPKKANDYKDASSMRPFEKEISFLNRYFVYKKTSTRNAEKLTKTLLEQLPDEIEFENAGTMLAREAVIQAEQIIKPKAKRLTNKLILQDATEALEEFEITVKPKKTTVRKPKAEKEKE